MLQQRVRFSSPSQNQRVHACSDLFSPLTCVCWREFGRSPTFREKISWSTSDPQFTLALLDRSRVRYHSLSSQNWLHQKLWPCNDGVNEQHTSLPSSALNHSFGWHIGQLPKFCGATRGITISRSHRQDFLGWYMWTCMLTTVRMPFPHHVLSFFDFFE